MDTIKALLEVDYTGQNLTVLKTIDGNNAMRFNKLTIVKFKDGVGLKDDEDSTMWMLETPKKDEDN